MLTPALDRVRLIVSTDAPTTAITVSGATIASYVSSVLAGRPGLHSSQTGHTLQLSRNVDGSPAEAQFDVILADLGADLGRDNVTWNLTTDAPTSVQLEVYALTDLSRPRLVDRFEARLESGKTSAQFTTAARLVDSGGRLRLTRLVPRLVLAFLYPWYPGDTWDDPQFLNHPLDRYSTDSPADLARIAAQARSAGIDVFVVAWGSLETAGADNDRRLRLILDSIRGAGLQACAYPGTDIANPTNQPGVPTDPETMLRWLIHLVDEFGSHPAYLRIDGRPVIFIYFASGLSPSDWTDLMARLHATGRNPLLIGDFYHSTLLEPFDGEHQYTNAGLSVDDLLAVDRTESLRVRTYHLLRPNGKRRIWVATVNPGFDDHVLVRPTHLVSDRENGRHYDDQWTAAVETDPDWVVISTWNEWFENSEIEPSVKYGSFYLDRTRYWTGLFKESGTSGHRPASRAAVYTAPPDHGTRFCTSVCAPICTSSSVGGGGHWAALAATAVPAADTR